MTYRDLVMGLSISLLMFSFPLQVLAFSPLPSLLPYVAVIFIVIIFRIQRQTISLRAISILRFIRIYILIVIISLILTIILETPTIDKVSTSIVIYIFPLLFFWFYAHYAKNRDTRILLISIMICGGISGLYFMYDSISMLMYGRVNSFSYDIINYVDMRSSNEVNIARIVGYSRSHGLLEKHSVSAAWIAFAGFAWLRLIPFNSEFKKNMAISITLIVLLISLNFTSIISFIVVLILVEYRSQLPGKKKSSRINIRYLIYGIVFIFVMSSLLGVLFPDMYNTMGRKLSGQFMLGSGERALRDGTYFGFLMQDILDYPINCMKHNPYAILFGDSFSGDGIYPKGGDYGFMDSLYTLGAPLYFSILIGLSLTIFRSLKNVRTYYGYKEVDINYYIFGLETVFYIILNDIHYSIWSRKSILPILFISAALMYRYSPKPVISSPQSRNH
jgi:hypothetical protein